MNQLCGTVLKDMPVRNLRLTIAAMGNNASRWNKKECVEWLGKRQVDIGVGKLCKLLLRVVVRVNGDGYPVGLSYVTMLEIVKTHFPNSAVNKRHFSWYATTMRANGEMIPVYRE